MNIQKLHKPLDPNEQRNILLLNFLNQLRTHIEDGHEHLLELTDVYQNEEFDKQVDPTLQEHEKAIGVIYDVINLICDDDEYIKPDYKAA